jgi:hypothetical protein
VLRPSEQLVSLVVEMLDLRSEQGHVIGLSLTQGKCSARACPAAVSDADQAQIWGLISHGGGGGMVQQARALDWDENPMLRITPTNMPARARVNRCWNRLTRCTIITSFGSGLTRPGQGARSRTAGGSAKLRNRIRKPVVGERS